MNQFTSSLRVENVSRVELRSQILSVFSNVISVRSRTHVITLQLLQTPQQSKKNAQLYTKRVETLCYVHIPLIYEKFL